MRNGRVIRDVPAPGWVAITTHGRRMQTHRCRGTPAERCHRCPERPSSELLWTGGWPEPLPLPAAPSSRCDLRVFQTLTMLPTARGVSPATSNAGKSRVLDGDGRDGSGMTAPERELGQRGWRGWGRDRQGPSIRPLTQEPENPLPQCPKPSPLQTAKRASLSLCVATAVA